MEKKKLILVWIITILAILIFGFVLIRAFLHGGSFSWTNQFSYEVEHPSKLLIPAINVDAKVQDVGVTYEGNMGVPDNYTDVGWYKYGTHPGQIGSAVLAGHVDNGLSLPGVFKHLEDLKDGDDVYVMTDSGSKLHFVVTGSKIYGYKDSTEEIFNQKDSTLLRLITCTGDWIPSAKTDDKRLVVTATLVSK